MFKKHYDNMRPGATPERVLAMARLIAKTPCTREDLVRLTTLQLSRKESVEEELRSTLSTLVDLGLIQLNNNLYNYTASKEAIADTERFRCYVADRVLSDPETTFFRVSAWFIACESKVFAYPNFETYAEEARKSGIDRITENDILGWRFWITFLGVGYQCGRSIIPNMKQRLEDKLRRSLEPGTAMIGSDFVEWLRYNLPEAGPSIQRVSLPLAVSSGLRTLHELGFLQLVAERDAARIRLFPVRAQPLSDFSKVEIKG